MKLIRLAIISLSVSVPQVLNALLSSGYEYQPSLAASIAGVQGRRFGSGPRAYISPVARRIEDAAQPVRNLLAGIEVALKRLNSELQSGAYDLFGLIEQATQLQTGLFVAAQTALDQLGISSESYNRLSIQLDRLERRYSVFMNELDKERVRQTEFQIDEELEALREQVAPEEEIFEDEPSDDLEVENFKKALAKLAAEGRQALASRYEEEPCEEGLCGQGDGMAVPQSPTFDIDVE